MADFRMPSLGADMDAGRLIEWYVKPGDAVHRGDIVALVDTDKAAIEVEIFDEGVVGALLVEPGATVPVGTAMARIEVGGVAAARAAAGPPFAAPPTTPPVAAPSAASPVAAPLPTPPVAAPPVAPPTPVHASPSARAQARAFGVDLREVRGSGRHGVVTGPDVLAAVAARAQSVPAPAPSPEAVRLSPRARRLAEELSVDPAGLVGSGPEGAITGDDVRAASSAAPAPVPAPTPAVAHAKPSDERYAAMRRAIAAAMAKSKREIPHYYLIQPIDMETALTWLEARNLERPLIERVLPAALLLRAAVRAVAEVPEMNGFYRDGAFEPSAAVHLGVGISLRQGGLIAPAILDAQAKDLLATMAAIKDLVARTRTLQLRSSEMSEATITVTALGDQGVESVYGVIYPPQVALVGFGKVVERPWAQGGMLGVRRVVHATLAADHRASDGHRGGLYLAAVDRFLQHPEEL